VLQTGIFEGGLASSLLKCDRARSQLRKERVPRKRTESVAMRFLRTGRRKDVMRTVALLIAGTALASCQTADRAAVEAALPDRAAFAADAAFEAGASTDWLAAFSSPTLDSLVAEALENNNSLASTRATVRASREQARQARSSLLPTLGLSGDARRSAFNTSPQIEAQTGRTIPPQRQYFNSYGLAATLSWEIDLWGRLADQTRAVYADAAAAAADFDASRLSLAGRTAQGWFNLIEARQQRELAERDVANRRSSLASTERRYDEGVTASLDVRLARSALGTAEANLAFRRRAELEASRSLEVLLGRYPAAELAGGTQLPSLPPLPSVGAPADILVARPDVVAAERRLAAAGLRAREARKQLLPQLTLSSSVNTSTGEASLADLLDIDRLAGNLAAGLVQPLFQGGRLVAQARERRRRMEASVYDYVETVLGAFLEAENALAAEALLAERERALRTAFEDAAAGQSLTERRYELGRATIFELLDSQQRRINAESQYLTGLRERLANRVDLHLAVGGAFEAPAAADASAYKGESA